MVITYLPNPAPFLTPQLTGGAMIGVLTEIAEDMALDHVALAYGLDDPGGRYERFTAVRVQSYGGGPHAVVRAGVFGPRVMEFEFGSDDFQGGRSHVGLLRSKADARGSR
jgi:hypothetical protein